MEEGESGQGRYNDSPSARFARNGNSECHDLKDDHFENHTPLPVHP